MHVRYTLPYGYRSDFLHDHSTFVSAFLFYTFQLKRSTALICLCAFIHSSELYEGKAGVLYLWIV